MKDRVRQRIVASCARLNHSTSIRQSPSHTQATGNRIVDQKISASFHRLEEILDSDTMRENCPTCELLWKEFCEATKAHAAILAKSELAETDQNSATVTELEPLKLATAERRTKARIAVRSHDATHRDTKAKRQKA